MGDNLLMKTTLILLMAVVLSNTLYSKELQWVDEQIAAIKPPRKSARILAIRDPFIFLNRKKPEKKVRAKSSFVSNSKASTAKPINKQKREFNSSTFTLSAIINSSAMINGHWYKKSDKISSYTIVDISKTSVRLKKGDREIMLSTNVRKQNLKFKNK